MENTTATENTPYTLPECTLTAPEGMRFSAWSIGTPAGERKAVGEAIILTETISLYAIWETIPHDHSFGTDFETDANEHWNECECGDKANVAAHADTDNDEKCDVCGYAMPKAPSNNETEKPTDATDKPTDATESEKDDSTETEAPADKGCGGCGSSAALSALAIVAVVGSALIIKKKED